MLPPGDVRQVFVDADDIAAAAAGRPGCARGADPAEVKAVAALRALGDGQPDSVVRRVTCREPKDFETYAAEAAARYLGNARAGGSALWLSAPTRERADRLFGMLADYRYVSWLLRPRRVESSGETRRSSGGV